MGDGELVGKTLAGSTAAFSELVARYRDMVFGLALHTLGNRDDAQDAAQEAFVRAYLRLGQLRDPERFAPWLRRVAANVCTDALRARGTPPRSLDEMGETAAGASGDDPERAAVRLAVREALAGLPDPLRLTVTLFHINGYSQEEVGRFLGISANTVRGRLQRARRHLRAELEGMMKEDLEQGKPGEELNAQVLRRITAADVWAMDPQAQGRSLGARFLMIDGEPAEIRLGYRPRKGQPGPDGADVTATVYQRDARDPDTVMTRLDAEATIAASGDRPISVYRLMGHKSRYYVFGRAQVMPDGPEVEDQIVEVGVQVNLIPRGEGRTEPWQPAEVSSAQLWAMSPDERDRFLRGLTQGNMTILLDGALARARLLGGGPGGGTASAGSEVSFHNVGSHSLHVYHQELPRPRYVIFGEAEVTPPGIRVKDAAIVLEARVDGAQET